MAKVHIGKKIKDTLDKTSMTVTAFAEKIGLSRGGANKIFKKERISTDQLQKISKVLEHDFFKDYSSSLPDLNDKRNAYGFATKDEVENLSKLVHTLVKEFEKLREELPKAPSKTKPSKKKK